MECKVIIEELKQTVSAMNEKTKRYESKLCNTDKRNSENHQKGIFQSQEDIEITMRYQKKNQESFEKDMEEIIFRHMREADWIEKVGKKIGKKQQAG